MKPSKGKLYAVAQNELQFDKVRSTILFLNNTYTILNSVFLPNTHSVSFIIIISYFFLSLRHCCCCWCLFRFNNEEKQGSAYVWFVCVHYSQLNVFSVRWKSLCVSDRMSWKRRRVIESTTVRARTLRKTPNMNEKRKTKTTKKKEKSWGDSSRRW